jgi:hypothetical protein
MTERAVIFLVEGIETDSRFKNFVQQFESEGYQTYVLIDSVKNRIRPEDVFPLLHQNIGDKLNALTLGFVSNIRDFFVLMYRLFHDTFAHFIFYDDPNHAPMSALEEPIYQALLSAAIQPDEQLLKPVYYYPVHQNEAPLDNRWPWTPLGSIGDLPLQTDAATVSRIYAYRNQFYRFESPNPGALRVIQLHQGSTQTIQGFHAVEYRYPGSMPAQIHNALMEISHSPQRFRSRYENYQELFNLYADMLKSMSDTERHYSIRMLEDTLLVESSHYRSFVLSFLLSVRPDARYRNQILEMALREDAWTAGQKFFVFYQSVRRGFVNPNISNADTGYLQMRLYCQIYDLFKQQLIPEQRFIPRQERNQDLVFVMIGQLLSLNHAPTKTVLDRCYTLMKHMNKKVLLINTKELLSTKEIVPFYEIAVGNVYAGYSDMQTIEYKDLSIPLYQPAVEMPDIKEMAKILKWIEQQKPYFILSIGGSNLTVDLGSNYVPVINISTPYVNLPISRCQFPVIGRKATEKDRKFMRDFGMNPDNLIESVFTFDFKSQTHHYTRAQFGLPEHGKLLALIGYRLDEEVTEELLLTLLGTIDANTHIVFVGGFDLTKWTDQLPALKQHATNLGFQEDVLAILELCDIYVNPKRTGGGTSVVEAMFKGIPAVTLPFGDVATSVPDEFRVESYEAMKDLIIRYATDEHFYKRMSEKARETAAILMNTRDELQRIVQQAESSPDF